MDTKEYIASGILELYVAGTLSELENLEVYINAQKYPEIKKEIEDIEASVLSLSKSVSPGTKGFGDMKNRMAKLGAAKTELISNKVSWTAYLGWAASLVFMGGLIWLYQQNDQLKLDLEVVSKENNTMEQQIADSQNSLEKTEELLNTIRDKNVTVVALGGQTVSPTSYAKAYWNKVEKKVFIDAQGLPDPPDGFVYQVWSLKLNPLTPTSMGLLEDFVNDENKVFALTNPNESEAFGITLEPAGGSETPTLEQLYTLGVATS
ncbi:Anti-sigma-K factor rskA [Arenibacter palladensis]|uniref:Anti-sigma-K factor rskA n=1 Tax=Arenibacter palladensis TaxID=237373 RepID=A0A1M4YK20_9FLAO|nr:anti-sigma factor [Arenibacter palladensis]SHF06008.1 Anti-sigma-K factor rskA [Arenibacter palladensis]